MNPLKKLRSWIRSKRAETVRVGLAGKLNVNPDEFDGLRMRADRLWAYLQQSRALVTDLRSCLESAYVEDCGDSECAAVNGLTHREMCNRHLRIYKMLVAEERDYSV